MASVHNEKRVVCSRNVVLEADVLLDSVSSNQYDVICLPGGLKGAENFANCGTLQNMIKNQREKGRKKKE